MNKLSNKIVPVLITEQFDGQRLLEVQKEDARLKSDAFGFSFTSALLFSKRVGSKDLSAYNMMIDACGNVLQVDMNMANDEQVQKFNQKGLQTSFKFDARFIDKAKEFTVENRQKVAGFLRNLVTLVPLRSGVVGDIFSDVTIDALESSEEGAVTFTNMW